MWSSISELDVWMSKPGVCGNGESDGAEHGLQNMNTTFILTNTESIAQTSSSDVQNAEFRSKLDIF